MTEREIQSLLAQHLFVRLGYERNTPRAHLLFWSEIDRTCFIAVVDERTQEMITVLPLTYENRFHMSLESVDLARLLWDQRPQPHTHATSPTEPTPEPAPTPDAERAWHLAAQVLEAEGGLKMKNLGRFRPILTGHLDDRIASLKSHLSAQLSQRTIPWDRVTYVRAKTRTGEVLVLYRNRWIELDFAYRSPDPLSPPANTESPEPQGVFIWPEELTACG